MTDDMIGPVDADVARAAPDGRRRVADRSGRRSARIDPDAVDADARPRRASTGSATSADSLHEAGAGAPTQQGSVAQISTSDGGVPKDGGRWRPTSAGGACSATVRRNRKHHGRPFQALCLWSAEVIDALVAEGHPIQPGAAGENITVRGIDWATLRPGVRLLIGQVVVRDLGVGDAVPQERPVVHRPLRPHRPRPAPRAGHGPTPGSSSPAPITTGDPVIVEP